MSAGQAPVDLVDEVLNTYSLATKDIDGDGDLDLVTANKHGIRVYRNPVRCK